MAQQHECILQRTTSDGQHCIEGIKSFEDRKSCNRFNILALIPPYHPILSQISAAAICEAKLLLGESSDNLTKVNSSVKINADVTLTMGLAICANLVFLCCLFSLVQDNADPTFQPPSLCKAAIINSVILFPSKHSWTQSWANRCIWC